MCVSVPYSSGQWLQPLTNTFRYHLETSFSPLFIGSMAATGKEIQAITTEITVSVPYSSGQWLQLLSALSTMPFSQCFSPLFIGSMAATAASGW